MSETKSFYVIYKEMELDISALDAQIESWKKQRANWIRSSGPHDVKAQAFDLDKGVAGIVMTELQTLNEISRLTVLIAVAESNREIATKKFEELKMSIRETKKAVDERGKVLKVFVSMVLDGHTAQETAEIHNIELQTVYNYKTMVNREMNGNGAS